MQVSDLPTLNASLNGCASVLLFLGYVFIRRGDKVSHQRCMMAAFVCSCIFLISYVTHKVLVRGVHTPLGATGAILLIYRAMLVSHIILAIAVVPLALTTIRRGLAGQNDRHRQIARITWPIWMYVSVTGVLIYFALYHWFPAKG
jgi:putative membrane protein